MPVPFSSRLQNGTANDCQWCRAENSWSIKGGHAFAQIHRKNDDSLEIRFAYPFGDFLPAETLTLLRIRWSYREVEKLSESLDISPEQIQQLRAVSPTTDIPVTNIDRQELRDLFDACLAAPDKTDAEKALIEAVTSIDGMYYDRTMQRVDRLTSQVVFPREPFPVICSRSGQSKIFCRM